MSQYVRWALKSTPTLKDFSNCWHPYALPHADSTATHLIGGNFVGPGLPDFAQGHFEPSRFLD